MNTRSKITALTVAVIGAFSLGAVSLSTPAFAAAPSAAVQSAEFLKTIQWDAEYDVVVHGYGFAGAATAITAADQGAKVLLSEKAPKGHEGGNSRYAHQHAMYVDKAFTDEQALKYLQLMRGKNTNPSDATLLAYIRLAKEQIEYLKFLGAEDPQFYQTCEYPEFEGCKAFGLAAVALPGADGRLYALMQGNVEKRADKIDVWFNAPGTKLIQDPATGIIHGVVITVDGVAKNVRAKNGVVLATGGYENNPEMFRNYADKQVAYAKGARYNTGDGILMAMDVKADIVNMANNNGPDPNVINPATGNAFGYMIAGSKDYDASGPAFTRHDVIMVGADGKRFWNETLKTNHGRIKFHADYTHLNMPDPAYMIFDEDARRASKLYHSWSEGNLKEIESGLVKKADTIEELAKIIGADPKGLADQVATYNEACRTGVDKEFGRGKELLKPLDHAPYYAVPVAPTYTNTLGGPLHDEIGAILDRDGKRIPHLFSAGELGSIWSHKYNGNGNVGECLVFGRISGASAAKVKTDVTQDSVMGGRKAFNQVQKVVKAEAAAGEKLGEARGIGGKIVVAVKKDGDRITSIRVVEQNETPGIGAPALETLPERALKVNGPVDAVTGATITTRAFNEALKNALSK
ncbi:FAD-binding protein [Sutterella sp.]|uniref:FAD-binding protein n=1 Tax=Sutterella sp. TaxID=1981025 RepID=UPI0026E075E1|nr:FAD-binding protein [Sutterella sp.]MDO5532879.1 FAD-binding protein [Sutterella sp.]